MVVIFSSCVSPAWSLTSMLNEWLRFCNKEHTTPLYVHIHLICKLQLDFVCDDDHIQSWYDDDDIYKTVQRKQQLCHDIGASRMMVHLTVQVGQNHLQWRKKMKKTNGLLVSVLFLITGLSTPLTLVLFLAVKRNTGSWQITRKSGEVRWRRWDGCFYSTIDDYHHNNNMHWLFVCPHNSFFNARHKMLLLN